MKLITLFVAIALTLTASAQQQQPLSHADSVLAQHRADSVNNLVKTKMVINAQFIDSVMQIFSAEMKKSFTIDQIDEYYKALNIQNYILQRLVRAWTDQYAIKQKQPK